MFLNYFKGLGLEKLTHVYGTKLKTTLQNFKFKHMRTSSDLFKL